MLRVPVDITLLRGRTEPEDAGRAADVEVLLLVVVRALLEAGLLLEEGFAPVVGFVPVEGALVFGAVGVSDAGGTFACATGSPPLDRL